MTQSVPAIFLDRDGTINVDHGYVHEIDNFHFIDGVIDACRELKKMGFALVMVTNQSGIARGKFSEDQFMYLTEWMDWSLADRDVDFDGIYFCPHHPEAVVEEYRQVCDCRKPQPGMLLQAQQELNIDMALTLRASSTCSGLVPELEIITKQSDSRRSSSPEKMSPIPFSESNQPVGP